MIGISSRSAGVLLLPKTGTDKYSVLDVVGGEEQDPVEAKYLYSAVRDWEEIGGPDADSLLKIASREYWLAQTVSLLRLAIGGLEESLEKEVLEHVEELLGTRVSSEETLDRLLVAPLHEHCLPNKLAKSALSKGFSVVASVLDELADLQPLLHRLTDIWLSLDEALFSGFSESKEMIWVTLVEKHGVKQYLNINCRKDFITKWNLLAFDFPTPQSKSGIVSLGNEISCLLFPHEVKEIEIKSLQTEVFESESYDQMNYVERSHENYKKIEKQIAVIAHAVSEGRDTNAKKFLRQLIKEQTSLHGGESYAVKTLCNIAQRCADMFRTDFEIICLDEARRLDPYDGWTLIQYGDHLKRVEDYDRAIESFKKAEKLGESDVAKSSIADVYTHAGNFARAILVYEAIPNYQDKPEVLMGIADNLRKMGDFEKSEAAYIELIQIVQERLTESNDNEIRAQVGIAEIAKQRGKLKEALQKYCEILKRKELDDRNRLFYKLGMCNVLKLMDRFSDAFPIVDEVIQEYPFFMQARFIRGSILGLIGRELEGLKDLPESSMCRSWHEWLRCYYRGILLFKLKRYEEAKKNLVDELANAVASGEDKSILRMAAALWFLREDGEVSDADKILSKIPDLNNCHVQYLSLVLKLHSAARREDAVMMHFLKKQISELQVVNATLEKAIVAIDKRNFVLALNYESDAFLKLAA